MWRPGGLSPGELLKRTARETWEDDVFGQAARLAFYYFLAIFPVLTLLLFALARLDAGADMRRALAVAALVMAALAVTHVLGGEVRAARLGQSAATIVFLML